MSNHPLPSSGARADTYNRNLLIAAVIAAALFVGLFLAFIVAQWQNVAWTKLARDHTAAVLGLPIAMIGTFIVVSIFRTVDGNIRFKALTVEFEGASGPIVMWILCFLAIVGGISTLMHLQN